MTDCVHNWQVNDRGTRGTCKLCGKIVVYPDYLKLTVLERRAMNKEAHRQVVEARKVSA